MSILLLFLLAASSGAFCDEASLPAVARAFKFSGDRFLKEGDARGAIREYRQALTLAPSSGAAHFNLAIAHYALREFEPSAAALENVIELDPSDIEAIYNLACIKLCQNKTAEARKCLEKAKMLCAPDCRFLPLAHQGLQFLEAVKELDSEKQTLFFDLLCLTGLPASQG